MRIVVSVILLMLQGCGEPVNPGYCFGDGRCLSGDDIRSLPPMRLDAGGSDGDDEDCGE